MRLAVTGLKLAVSATLLWILFRNIALASLIGELKNFRPDLLALVLLLALVQILLFAVRWRWVGQVCGAPLSWGAGLRLVFIGLFFNQTLPSSIGGDGMRIWLSSRLGVPVGRAFSSVAVDRFVALIMLLGLSLATLPLFTRLVGDQVLRQSLAILLAAGAAGFIILLAAGSAVGAYLGARKATSPFGAVVTDLRGLFLRPAGLGIAALSVIIHLMSVAIVFLIAHGLGVALSGGAALVLVPPILLVQAIPVTIAGWGLRESAMVVTLAQIHVAAPDALAISVLFGLLQIAVSLPGALLWLHRHERIPSRPAQG